jgi:hypothetical protein
VSCVAATCAAITPANSDKSSGSGTGTATTGQTVAVTCDSGYSGSDDAVCTADSNAETATFVFAGCTAATCTATQVANSDFAAANSIMGATTATETVTCDTGYTGGGTMSCTANAGLATSSWTGIPTCDNINECNDADGTHTCDANAACGDNDGSYDCTCNDGYSGAGYTGMCTANACPSTQVANSDKSDTASIAGATTDVETVACDAGYYMTGSATMTCDDRRQAWPLTCEQVLWTVRVTCEPDDAGHA